jgi:hypothetical protein
MGFLARLAIELAAIVHADKIVAKPIGGKLQLAPHPFRSEDKIHRTPELIGNYSSVSNLGYFAY